MKINDVDKEHISFLLQTGDKLAAVRYIQQTFSLNAEEALSLAETLEKTQKARNDLPLTKQPNLGRWVGITFTIAGFLLLSAGFIFGFRDYQFTIRALPVDGNVVSIEGPPSYQPLIEYTIGGHTYNLTGEKLSANRVYVLGESVPLLVDPSIPQDAKLNSFFERWFAVVMLAGIGLAFSIIGFVVRKVTTNSSHHS